jgi:hypothetical protein
VNARAHADENEAVRQLAAAALQAERKWRARAIAGSPGWRPARTARLEAEAAAEAGAEAERASRTSEATEGSPPFGRSVSPATVSPEGMLQRQQDARRRIYLRLKAEQRGERATCAAYTLVSRRLNGLSPPVE